MRETDKGIESFIDTNRIQPEAFQQAEQNLLMIEFMHIWETSISFLIFGEEMVFKACQHEHQIVPGLDQAEVRKDILTREMQVGLGLDARDAYNGVFPISLRVTKDGRPLEYIEQGRQVIDYDNPTTLYEVIIWQNEDSIPEGVDYDWALIMRRFDFNENWAKKLILPVPGSITEEQVRDVVQRVVCWQRGLAVDESANEKVRADYFDEHVRAVDFKAMEETGAIDVQRLGALEAREAKYIKSMNQLFNERIDQGWVKRGHGDVKSSNIYGRKGVILDACVCYDKWQCNDLLAEIAYFVLDFDFYLREGIDLESERCALGYNFWQVINDEYFRHTGEYLLNDHLFWFYMNYRAWVEAKVAGFEDRENDANKRFKNAESYLRTAYQLAGLNW